MDKNELRERQVELAQELMRVAGEFRDASTEASDALNLLVDALRQGWIDVAVKGLQMMNDAHRQYMAVKMRETSDE